MNLSFVVFEPVSSRVLVEIEISCSQWEGSACTHDEPCFCLLGVGGGVFFVLASFFPMCS